MGLLYLCFICITLYAHNSRLGWQVTIGNVQRKDVYYFGNKFGDESCTVSSVVMWGEIELYCV